MADPIFILSLPRSGSTLLQRLLLASGQCATLGEPSLLLRFLGDSSKISRYTSYRDSNVEISMRDMRSKWAGFDQSYSNGVRNLMLDIYNNLADGQRYFIDKTPRYTLIAEELIQTFPNAKFIVLWRHPLAVAASMSSTFYKGLWRFDDFTIDLTTGLDRLHAFENAHSPKICSIRYEDLVSNQEEALTKIGNYLGIENLASITSKPLPKSAGGSLGDSSGTKKYNTLSTESRDQWICCYNNWYRHHWAKKYYKDSRATWLNSMGYNLPNEIQNVTSGARPIDGLHELIQVRRKQSSTAKHFARTYKKEHISTRKP